MAVDFVSASHCPQHFRTFGAMASCQQLMPASSRSLFNSCIEIDLQVSVGKHDGGDIAPDHHDWATGRDPSLLRDEGSPDTAVGGHRGYVGIHLRRTDRPSDVDTVSQNCVPAPIVDCRRHNVDT